MKTKWKRCIWYLIVDSILVLNMKVFTITITTLSFTSLLVFFLYFHMYFLYFYIHFHFFSYLNFYFYDDVYHLCVDAWGSVWGSANVPLYWIDLNSLDGDLIFPALAPTWGSDGAGLRARLLSFFSALSFPLHKYKNTKINK